MKRKHFFSLLILICATLIIGFSCSKSSSSNSYTPTPPGGGSSGSDISIYNMSYSPATKTVAKGTVVKWTNNDSYAHTVTSDDGTTFDSDNIGGGSTYSYTANTAGTFNYHCKIHGVTMAGTLIVTP